MLRPRPFPIRVEPFLGRVLVYRVGEAVHSLIQINHKASKKAFRMIKTVDPCQSESVDNSSITPAGRYGGC